MVRRRLRQTGSVMLEFGLCMLLLTPLSMGVFAVGSGVSRYLQANSIARSAASMFVRGADFSTTPYQRRMARIVDGVGMTTPSMYIDSSSSSRGVIMLSTLMRVGGPECTAGGFTPPSYAGCTNRGRVVVTKRVVLGNSALRLSSFGQPSATIINQGGDTDGTIRTTAYLTNTTAVVPSFGIATSDNAQVTAAPVDLRAGETTFVAETYIVAPELNVFPRIANMQGYYARYMY